jgi:hypothetical protein
VGQQATCTVRYKGEHSTGAARLEEKELWFRGAFRLRIPFDRMESVEAVRGEMRVRFEGETAAFVLGSMAEDWTRRILHPKSRADKLGIKPGATVSMHELSDNQLLEELEARDATVIPPGGKGACDLVFAGVSRREDLVGRLRAAVRDLKPAGALWVVRPKGRPEITESDVMSAGKAAGLVDVKVVSFSETHTAEKFVIPVAKRPAASSTKRSRATSSTVRNTARRR